MSQTITQAVVLAGGRGTRLGELTTDTPKPLLSVGGRPFLEWVIANLARHGIERVVLTVGYRAEVFESWLEAFDGSVHVTIFREEEPLGTGGALTLLGSELDETVLILNGDTLFDADLAALTSTLKASGGDLAIALRSVPDVERFGSVHVSENRLVVSFSEKGAEGAGLINGGVYALHSAVLVGRSAPLSIEQDLIPELVAERRVTGVPCDGFFIDIGVPETYRDAQRTVPAWWARVESRG